MARTPATLDTVAANFPPLEARPVLHEYKKLIEAGQFNEARNYADNAVEHYRQLQDAWNEAEGFAIFREAMRRATTED